jgi:recombination protein RecA
MSLAAQLAAALSKGGVKSDVAKDNGLYLSTGVPNVDHALSGRYRGGGLKTGRMYEIAGPSSSGKTLLAQHVMKEAQLAGGAAAFKDHERTFMEHLYQSFGGSIEPGLWTYNRPRTFEESLDQAVDWMTSIRKADVIPFEAPLAVVFDSLHAMVPAAKLDRDMSQGQNMKDKLGLAMATSAEFPAFATFVEENNIIAIFLNQLRTKPGVVYGDPRYTPGGDSMEFYASARLFLSRSMEKDKNTKEVTGQKITAESVKNKTHRPFQKASWLFKFKEDGTGFIDVPHTMIDHIGSKVLTELGIQAGAWFTWEGQRFNGEKNFIDALHADPAAVSKLIDIAEKHASILSPVSPAAAAA